MSDEADSAFDAQADAGPTGEVGDSMTPAVSDGQERASQSSDERLNGLQSTLGKRTQERDEAQREIADLRAQLVEASRVAEPERMSQGDLMRFGPDGRPPDPEPDSPLDAVEDVGIIAKTSPPRPDYRQKPPEPQQPDRLSAFLNDRRDIAAMKERLESMVRASLSD